MSPRQKLVARYLMAVIAAALLLAFTDIDAVSKTLRTSDHLLVLVGILVGFASWVLNTVKWQLLLRSRGIRARLFALYRLNLTGALYGTVLPGQVAGEAAKMLRLAQAPSERAQLVASVAADRMTGLLGLWLVGLVGGFVAGAPWSVLALIVAGAAVTTVICAAALVGTPRVIAPPSETTSAAGIRLFLAKSKRAVLSLWNALGEYRTTPRALWIAMGLSFCFQALVTINVTIFAAALDLNVGVTDMAWIMAVVAIVQLLPITVAAVGTRDVAFVVLMDQIGVTSSDAVALSFLVLVGNLAVALAGAVSDLLPASELRPNVDASLPVAPMSKASDR